MDPQTDLVNGGLAQQPDLSTTHTVDIEKNRQIEEIIRADRQAFEEWIAQPDHEMNLDMPPSALRWLLIPRRILELAADPKQVNVVTIKKEHYNS